MSSEIDGRYFIRSRGRVTGPYTTEQLRALRTRGQFGRLHEISEDRQTWKSAASLDAFFAAAPTRSARNSASTQPEPQADTYLIPTGAPSPGPESSNVGTPLPMKAVWHYAIGNQPYGPVTLLEIRNLIDVGQLKSKDLIFREGLEDWQPISEIPEFQDAGPGKAKGATGRVVSQTCYCHACGQPIDHRAEICPQCGVSQRHHENKHGKNRVTAALLAFFLGGFGSHHFYLGNTALGVVYILSTLLVIPVFIGINSPSVVDLPGVENRILILWAVPWVIATIESIVYLTMSDSRFQQKYGTV